MKTRTVGKSAVILSCAILLAAALSALVALAVPKRDSSGTLSHTQISAAATPEPGPAAPVKRVNCPLCGEPGGGGGNQAYLIDSAECLRWLFDNARTPAELSACYVLDLPEVAAGGASVKYLDITGWSDTGVGACAETAAAKAGHACAQAFTGHFYGGNCTLKFAFTENANQSANGGLGLFPCMRGAKIADVTLDVTQTARIPEGYNPKVTVVATEPAFEAPLGAYAGGGTAIEGVNVSQRFTQSGYHASFGSAGLVGFNDTDSRIVDCSVVSMPNEGGEAPAVSALDYYGGVAFLNNGVIENCTYAYRGGNGGVLYYFGGIVYANGGTVQNSAAEVSVSGAWLAGGIAYEMIGGVIDACSTNVNVANYGMPQDCWTTGVGGILRIVNVSGWEGVLNDGPMLINGCRASGGVIAAKSGSGGILGWAKNARQNPVELKDCAVTIGEIGAHVEIDGNSNGGVLGRAEISYDVTLTGCTSTANVAGNRFLGGLVGSIHYQDAADGSVPAAGVRFTMKDCHSYAQTVTNTKYFANSYAGGAIGGIDVASRTTDDISTYIEGCTASADVTVSGSCAGGFIGAIYSRERADKPADRAYTIENCAAYGNVTVISGGVVPDHNDTVCGNAGGFVGYVNSTYAANIAFKGCTAGGNVTGASDNATFHHLGGFAGLSYCPTLSFEACSATGNVTGKAGLGGFAGRVERASVTGCVSYGRVYAEWFSGGFAGGLSGGEIKNCTSYGDLESAGGNSDTHGGFVGVGSSTADLTTLFENCVAYGNVNGNNNTGGFAAYVSAAAGQTLLFKNCKAYGDVYGFDSYLNAGGFVAELAGAGSIVFENCVAYGDVNSYKRTGGFFCISSSGKFSFTDCAAYGNVTGRAALVGEETGGFGAWARGVNVDFLRCTAAGSVSNGAPGNTTRDSDCGGFLGVLSVVGTIDSCRASAASLVGGAGYTGTFIGAYYSNGTAEVSPSNTVIKNCQYREIAGIPMVGNRSGYGAVANISVNDTQNNTVNNAAIPGGTPSLTCTIAKSAANNDIIIAYANLANISGYVTELAVSADGGRTYTQLIYTSADKAYDGYVLTPVAGVAIGGKLQAQAFNYTLKNLGGYDKNKVVVRISFSNGFAKVFRGAAV